MENRYDEGTYGQITNPSRERMLDLMAKRGESEMTRAEQGRRQLEEAKYEDALTTGDEMTRGAMLGGAFSGGSPMGMGIGAGIGHLAGGMNAFKARRKKGEGFLSAGFNSFLNPVNIVSQLPSALSSPSAAPLAMMAGRSGMFAGGGGTSPGAETYAPSRLGQDLQQPEMGREEFAFNQSGGTPEDLTAPGGSFGADPNRFQFGDSQKLKLGY